MASIPILDLDPKTAYNSNQQARLDELKRLTNGKLMFGQRRREETNPMYNQVAYYTPKFWGEK